MIVLVGETLAKLTCFVIMPWKILSCFLFNSGVHYLFGSSGSISYYLFYSCCIIFIWLNTKHLVRNRKIWGNGYNQKNNADQFKFIFLLLLFSSTANLSVFVSCLNQTLLMSLLQMIQHYLLASFCSIWLSIFLFICFGSECSYLAELFSYMRFLSTITSILIFVISILVLFQPLTFIFILPSFVSSVNLSLPFRFFAHLLSFITFN